MADPSLDASEWSHRSAAAACRTILLHAVAVPLVVALFFPPVAPAQQCILSGTVRDRASGEPLVAANVRVLGTSRGTIANTDGYYRIVLEPGHQVIIFSLVGYRPDTLLADLRGPLEYNPRLDLVPIQLAEVVVTDEDPAVAIMRKVIENKKLWSERLRTYRLQAFTRVTVKRDTAIALVEESYSTGYWQRGDTLREVVSQKRQTQNIPGSSNFASVGGIVNFYDDEIRFAGFRFVGPTSPDAFAYYDFRLEKIRERDGTPTYIIGLHPRSRVTPLFNGTLNVVGDSFALIGVDVSPNEAFTLPMVRVRGLRYSQQFGLYEDRFWMPVDVSMEGEFSLNVAGISLPPVGVRRTSVIYDYAINPEIPDSVFRKPRLTELPEASKVDSSFWATKDVLPLTSEEARAYKTLDSTQTLEKQFKPSGLLTLMDSRAMSYLSYVSVRFNRVEGLFLGLDARFDSVTSRLALAGSGGYALSDKKGKYSFGAETFFDDGRTFSLGLTGFQELGNFPDEGYFDNTAILFGALFSKRDYRDYYYADGWKAAFTAKPRGNMFIQVAYRNADERSAFVRTRFSIFDQAKVFRPNPPVAEGTSRSVSLKARYGEEPVALGLIPRDYVEVEGEYSSPHVLASEFDFSRVVARGEVHLATFARRLFLPPALSLKFTAGMESKDAPPQRLFSLESQFDGFGPFGVLRGSETKEFSGRRFVVFAAEHNFRSTPFLLLGIPFLYENDIELIVHGATARSWASTPLPFGRTTSGWYAESGFGISRILGLFRFDYTYRFARPRGSWISFGVAQLL